METKSKFGIIATALFIDGMQALLTLTWVGIVFNPIITLCTTYLLNRWFKVYGINMFSKDNMGLFYGTIIAELIPFFDALPVWTTSVILTFARDHMRRQSSKNV